MKRLNIAAMLLIPLFMMGCAANPWEKNFEPNPGLAVKAWPATESVQVREVEFERLQKYAGDEKRLRVESTTNPADYSPQQRADAKNRLLETLQLKERGDEIEVLGWSEFSDNDRLDIRSSPLSSFGKSIGADYVVVASQYLGKVSTTIERPMTTYSTGYITTVPGRAGRRGYTRTESIQSTTWVPMNVIEDHFLYTAAFLRKTR